MRRGRRIKMKKGKFLEFALCFLFLILPGDGSRGETLEEVVNPKTISNTWVSDMAGVIDPPAENRLNTLITELERKTGAEIAVVTIRRTDGRTPKEFATALFNRWGVGKEGKDNGVLVLLVMEARRVEVETGYGIEGILTDGKVGEILRTFMVPRFKQGDFGGGVAAGVDEIVKTISGEEITLPIPGEPEHKQQTLSEKFKKRGSSSEDDNFWGLLILPLVILLALLGIYLVWRFLAPLCSKCGKRMRLLTEKQDDAYLIFYQKFEEELGSVDYQVWRCDDCQEMKIETRRFGGYSECPQCKHYTLYIHTIQLLEPTYTRQGLEEVRKKCRFPDCKYTASEKRKIPRLVKSESIGWSGGDSDRDWSGGDSGGGRSGGSFGGGSSGGGGAGASW